MNPRRPVASGAFRWLLTYADMITLLLAFFVMLYVISRLDAKRAHALTVSLGEAFRRSTLIAPLSPVSVVPSVAEEPPILPVKQRLLAELGEDLRAGRIEVEQVRNAVVLRFPDTILFDRGSAELRSSAFPLLARVARVLGAISAAVEVEGHTDTLPIASPRFPSNWELSVARATAVVRELVAVEGLSPLRLAARGLGEYQPRFPNDPVTGEPRNRRVEIRLLAR